MESENLDIESITEARRKAIEQSVEPIDIDKLKTLGEKIFPFFFDHPRPSILPVPCNTGTSLLRHDK